MAFKIGDSIKVNDGVLDPDNGIDISGWQGRITEIAPTYIMFNWDSTSLQAMGKDIVDKYEAEGFDWTTMGLEPDEVSLAEPRDSLEDVKKVVDILSKNQVYLHLDDGPKIQKILHGINSDDTMELEQRWYNYLEKTLRFPIKVEIFEGYSRGEFKVGHDVTLVSFDSIDSMYGIITNIESDEGAEGYRPLSELEVLNRKLKIHTEIANYADWYVNARKH